MLFFFLVTFPSQGAEKVRFGTPTLVEPHHRLLVEAAQEGGFWKETGLEVTWVALSGGGALAQAIAAGGVDVGLQTATAVIVQASRGLKQVAVADLKHPQIFAFWIMPTSRLKVPSDLKGAKIGVTRTGSLGHSYAMAVAKGLGLPKDVRYVSTGGIRETIAALRAGVVDTISQSYYVMADLEYRGEVKRLLTVQDYLPKEWVDMTVFARKDFTRDSPEAISRVVAATLKAGQFVMARPDWAVEKMQTVTGYSPGFAREIVKVMRYGKDGRFDIAGLRNVRQFLIDYGVVPKDKAPPLEEIYTEAFLK